MSSQSEASSTGEIDAAEVNRALAGTPLHGHVRHFPEVESTQTLALEAARAGARSGVWVADAQTAGRGRGGHTWLSAPGDGLYSTTLLTPRLPASTSSLALVAGLAAWDAIREVAGITVDIRWPNDLVTRPGVHATARKLGGVLVESAVAPPADRGAEAMLRYVVIGIGLNVGHVSFPPELAESATSLRLEGWAVPQRQALLIALLDRLHFYVGKLEDEHAGRENGPSVVSWLGQASTWLRGKRVQVPEDGGYTGVTAGLHRDGFLLVEDESGALRTVRSGGVREI